MRVGGEALKVGGEEGRSKEGVGREALRTVGSEGKCGGDWRGSLRDSIQEEQCVGRGLKRTLWMVRWREKGRTRSS